MAAINANKAEVSVWMYDGRPCATVNFTKDYELSGEAPVVEYRLDINMDVDKWREVFMKMLGEEEKLLEEQLNEPT